MSRRGVQIGAYGPLACGGAVAMLFAPSPWDLLGAIALIAVGAVAYFVGDLLLFEWPRSRAGQVAFVTAWALLIAAGVANAIAAL